MEAKELKTFNGKTLSGPLLITPKCFSDERGFFFESWNLSAWTETLSSYGQNAKRFVQDNHSKSIQGVLRGLHYQMRPHAQGKLVRVIAGEVFDIAVDIRLSSSTFGEWVGARLSNQNKKQLWIPEGFAHGFLVLSNHAEVLYKTTDFWSKDSERSIRWDDPQLAISWPKCQKEVQVSTKDQAASFFKDLSKSELFE